MRIQISEMVRPLSMLAHASIFKSLYSQLSASVCLKLAYKTTANIIHITVAWEKHTNTYEHIYVKCVWACIHCLQKFILYERAYLFACQPANHDAFLRLSSPSPACTYIYIYLYQLLEANLQQIYLFILIYDCLYVCVKASHGMPA